MEIADCSFIRRAENLLIAGLTGCGKSYPVPVAKRCDYIDEPTLADAIMNRLVENVFHIELKGESMRCRKKKINYLCGIWLQALVRYPFECYKRYHYTAIIINELMIFIN